MQNHMQKNTARKERSISCSTIPPPPPTPPTSSSLMLQPQQGLSQRGNWCLSCIIYHFKSTLYSSASGIYHLKFTFYHGAVIKFIQIQTRGGCTREKMKSKNCNSVACCLKERGAVLLDLGPTNGPLMTRGLRRTTDGDQFVPLSNDGRRPGKTFPTI